MNVWLVLSAAGVAGMTITALEDAKFTPVNPQRPQGAQMAVLWGDPNTDPSAMLLRIDRAMPDACAVGRAAGRTAGRNREELIFWSKAAKALSTNAVKRRGFCRLVF